VNLQWSCAKTTLNESKTDTKSGQFLGLNIREIGDSLTLQIGYLLCQPISGPAIENMHCDYPALLCFAPVHSIRSRCLPKPVVERSMEQVAIPYERSR